MYHPRAPRAPTGAPSWSQYSAGSAVARREPVEQGLLNRGYRLRTTRGGRYFLKHHADPETARTRRRSLPPARRDPAALSRPPASPSPRRCRTATAVRSPSWAVTPLRPAPLDRRPPPPRRPADTVQCGRLGALLGVVHASLERVMPGQRAECLPGADPADTFALIDDLLRTRPQAQARRRLRRTRPAPAAGAAGTPGAARGPASAARGCVGWVHGDFHPFNLLYKGDAPAAIVDWDRLGVQPRAEEAVRAAAIFFVRPDGAAGPAEGAGARARVPAGRAGPRPRTRRRRAPGVVGAAQRLLDAALALRTRRHPRGPPVPGRLGARRVVDAGVRRGVRGLHGVRPLEEGGKRHARVDPVYGVHARELSACRSAGAQGSGDGAGTAVVTGVARVRRIRRGTRGRSVRRLRGGRGRSARRLLGGRLGRRVRGRARRRVARAGARAAVVRLRVRGRGRRLVARCLGGTGRRSRTARSWA
ncbi:phosphotransferase, partial [Streptomyces sp. L7]